MSTIQATRRLKLAVIAMLFAGIVCPTAIAQRMNIRGLRYNHYRIQSSEALKKGDLKKSIFYFDLMLGIAPYDDNTHYNLACAYALDGQTDAALDALETSIQCGWDDVAHMKADPDLDSLRKEDRYKELLKAANASADEKVFVYEPASAKNKSPKRLLVVLNGYGGKPRGIGNELIPLADRTGIPLAAIKGKGKTRWDGLYGWHKGQDPNDLDAEGTAKLIDDIASEMDVELQNIIVVGFSQGGAVALHLLGDYPGKYGGILTIAAGYDVDAFRTWVEAAKDHSLRAFMIAGALDDSQPRSNATLHDLEVAGVNFKYVQIPTVGHEMPPDSLDLYVEGIEFLTNEK